MGTLTQESLNMVSWEWAKCMSLPLLHPFSDFLGTCSFLDDDTCHK